MLIFEVLAERTLALAQLERRADPGRGYAPLMEAMLGPVLGRCLDHGIPVVSNFGAANPRAAARRIRQIALERGVSQMRLAVVEGDDLSDARGLALLREHLAPEHAGRELVSANAYLGAAAIAEALRAGAQVVVTGRVADPSLAVGPAMAHFGWGETDWDELARATIAGHLIECGAQVTGGYFADPGLKDVPDLHAVGFPIVEIDADGALTVGKADGTGGLVDARTVKEQLLYEMHDPAAYVTPDVVADISEAEVEQVGPDRVAVRGVRGQPRTETLKVHRLLRGRVAGGGRDLLRRAERRGPGAAGRGRHPPTHGRGPGDPLRPDRGAERLRRRRRPRPRPARPGRRRDVRLRVAASHPDRARVEALLREVTALYTCGPAGGGGVRTAITPRMNSASCLVPRGLVPSSFAFVEE